MTRLATILTTVLLALGTGACDKPSSEDCEKALRNMQRILGTDSFSDTATIQGEVRRCRGASSKAAVACAIKAETLDDLNNCDFEKLGKHGGINLAGSAGSGSAAGSAVGSAAPK
ncbi:MAG TPA: hypothetical protein VFQ65_10320 [Kofleriaceae bacterium]|nr:hypothetical protein [Kofleriaceae bacterium]